MSEFIKLYTSIYTFYCICLSKKPTKKTTATKKGHFSSMWLHDRLKPTLSKHTFLNQHVCVKWQEVWTLLPRILETLSFKLLGNISHYTTHFSNRIKAEISEYERIRETAGLSLISLETFYTDISSVPQVSPWLVPIFNHFIYSFKQIIEITICWV